VPVYETNEGVVTIPDDEIESEPEEPLGSKLITHEEIQWRLLYLGAQLGLDVWVARNDQASSRKSSTNEVN
jgi:hypothetical protein